MFQCCGCCFSKTEDVEEGSTPLNPNQVQMNPRPPGPPGPTGPQGPIGGGGGPPPGAPTRPGPARGPPPASPRVPMQTHRRPEPIRMEHWTAGAECGGSMVAV